ncbi:MAG: hypothetical protein JXL81_07815 [Deltaproteobacteria bacterium]|nr:hypothetical protein [Deltaproteobacteria bacterium]
MSLLYYRPPQNTAAERLQFIIETEVPDQKIEIFYSIEGFSDRLSQSSRGNCTAIILAANIHDLEHLVKLKNLLKDIRIILILPDRSEEVVSMGYKLHPRFLSYVDSEFNEVAVVLKKMIMLMKGNNNENYILNPKLN